MERLWVLARGFARHCPNCGERHIFRRWLTMAERCPRCGLFFEREEGYWTGAIAINTVVTELVFIAAIVAGIALTWPEIPTYRLLAVGLVINATFPVIFYPFSKTIWTAIDLVLHPLEPQEEREVQSLQRVRRRAPVD